jgi:hypothetical protein
VTLPAPWAVMFVRLASAKPADTLKGTKKKSSSSSGDEPLKTITTSEAPSAANNGSNNNTHAEREAAPDIAPPCSGCFCGW